MAQEIVDFNQVREQKLEEKRRKTERIFFKYLLSVYSVAGNSDRSQVMHPIEILEMSEQGCSFQVPFDAKNIWPAANSEIPLRLYFSQDTYMEVIVRIANSTPSIVESGRFVRYGCEVDPTTSAYPAYQQFVRFMKLYAEHAHKDKGDVTVFYL